MNGICKKCGTTGPLKDFLQRNEDVRTAAIINALPAQVATFTLEYLELFYPASGRAMAGSKTQRLVADLQALVCQPTIHKPGAVSRSCNPQIWADAMEQMLNQTSGLGLPMKNHNYLRSIAWAMAVQADAAAEKNTDLKRAVGVDRGESLPLPKGRDPLETIKQEWDRKHGHAEQG